MAGLRRAKSAPPFRQSRLRTKFLLCAYPRSHHEIRGMQNVKPKSPAGIHETTEEPEFRVVPIEARKPREEKRTMRKAAMLLTVLCLSVGMALAHGNEKHVMGKVTQVLPTEVTVQSTSGEVQTVKITNTTQFVRGGAAAALTDLKVGDKVVIHAKPVNGGLEASEVRFGSTTAQTAH